MKENIDVVLQSIEDDYKVCLKIIGKYFDYLETCGLKNFNRYSKYKWTYDRDKSNGYSYICIRYRNSLKKKSLIKKRAYIEEEDLYQWTKNKALIQEALDEAYQYIAGKLEDAKKKIEEIKGIAEEYNEKLEGLSEEGEDSFLAFKKLG